MRVVTDNMWPCDKYITNLRRRATPSTRRTGGHHHIRLPMLDDVHRCQHRWLGADEIHLMFGINSIHPDDDGVARALCNKQLCRQ